MEHFFIAASVVTPLVVYMLVGLWIRKAKLFEVSQFKALNVIIFKIFIPLALFFDVYKIDLSDALKPDMVLYVIALILFWFFVSYFMVPKIVPDRAMASSCIQTFFRSNYVLFGISIARVLCGDTGIAMVAAFAAIISPVFNIFAVILFESRRGGTVNVKKMLLNIMKNPLVQAGVLGALCNICKIPIPELLATPLSKLGSIATPLALVTLGGILSFGSMASHRFELTLTAAARLILVPLSAIIPAILLGYRGDTLVLLLAAFGSPAAVASVPMAQTMGGDGELAGEIVAVTTVLSVITIFLFVYVLSGAGFLV